MINYSHMRISPSDAGSSHGAHVEEGPQAGSRESHDFKMLPRTLILGKVREDLGNNKITTSKYTCSNFIFLNLFEQFSKIANVYFLVRIIIYT